MKSDKINAFITVLIISSVILFFAVADLFGEDRTFSETENRLLAKKPVFSAESLFKGEYTRDYETYVTDQFVGRDKWIAVKTGLDIILQKKEIGGVYLGSDGYLMEQHLPQAYSAELVEKRIGLLKKLVDKYDAKVMLVPTADNILSEKLPAFSLYFDQKAFLEQVESEIGQENYIDVYSVLNEHREEEIYYHTDHHWTSLGALYGYEAWARAMGEEAYPYGEMSVVTRDFLGTLQSKLNIPWKSDSICYFEETSRWPVSIVYDMEKESETLYEEKYLSTKNKYGFFLDDNHALMEITTGNNTGRTLFVIKDSYANCFVPLLLSHYDKICVLDLRYYNGRLRWLMNQYGKPGEMDVLVLYNCIHFLEEFQYME
ncbi:MAG: DHHW family protein [Acetatifactor sp.]